MVSERIQRRIETLLNEADEAVAISDWAVVRDRAQNVLAFDPDNKEAGAFLTAANRSLGTSPDSYPPPQPTEPPSRAVGPPEAERRQLTVMF